jgi:hypothetical protein
MTPSLSIAVRPGPLSRLLGTRASAATYCYDLSRWRAPRGIGWRIWSRHAC